MFWHPLASHQTGTVANRPGPVNLIPALILPQRNAAWQSRNQKILQKQTKRTETEKILPGIAHLADSSTERTHRKKEFPKESLRSVIQPVSPKFGSGRRRLFPNARRSLPGWPEHAGSPGRPRSIPTRWRSNAIGNPIHPPQPRKHGRPRQPEAMPAATLASEFRSKCPGL